jgi:solute carrier family 39 (zinc transporter), member 9
MEGLFTLLSLSAVMAVAFVLTGFLHKTLLTHFCSSFLAGLLPLSFSLTPSQLRLISTIGMGVLVGTSLIVIIPEGVEALYSASVMDNAHVKRASSNYLFAGIPQDTRAMTNPAASDLDASMMPGPVLPGSFDKLPSTPTTSGRIGILQKEGDKMKSGDKADNRKEQSPKDSPKDSPHAWIGVALIAGFVLMYLIDKVPRYTAPSKNNSRPYHISLNDLGRGLQRVPSPNRDTEAGEFLQSSSIGQERGRSFATTTGLVIHAAADGIALGASSSSANAGLSFIIFFAIMVHKAPAAFGLSSVLLKQGLSKRTARAHLLLFSLAAPTAAILTFLFAQSFGAGAIGNAQATKWWTGMLLLFSAGTFLYVAVHTMQEADISPEIQQNGHVNGIGEGRDAQSQPEGPSLRDLLAAVLGMLLPLFLQIGHAH